jgi:hypothetical protein
MYITINESPDFVDFHCPLLTLRCDISNLIILKLKSNLQYIYIKIQVVPHREPNVLPLLTL